MKISTLIPLRAKAIRARLIAMAEMATAPGHRHAVSRLIRSFMVVSVERVFGLARC